MLGLRGRQLDPPVTDLSEDLPSVQHQTVLFSSVHYHMPVPIRPGTPRNHGAVVVASSNRFGPQAATFHFVCGFESCAEIVSASRAQSGWRLGEQFDHDNIFIRKTRPFLKLLAENVKI